MGAVLSGFVRAATLGLVVVLWIACATDDSRGPGSSGSFQNVPGLPPAGQGAGAGAMEGTAAAPAAGVSGAPATGGAEAPVGGAEALAGVDAGLPSLQLDSGTSLPPLVLDAGAPDTGVDAAPEPRVFDAGTDPARNTVSAGALCDRLAEIQCAGEAYCCDAPGRDFAACKSAQLAVCQNDVHLDAISLRSETGFDATHAATAFAELERLASECDPTIAAFGESLAGLRGIFDGTVATGSTCTPLIPTDNVLAGAALASCESPSTHACLPGLIVWDCAERGGVGQDCFTDINCMDGLHCPNPDLMIGGASCIERKPVGASCSLPNECASLFCRGGSCVAEGVQAAYCLQ